MKTLFEFMDSFSTRSELYDALKPNSRNIRLVPGNTNLIDTLDAIISLARNSIEQHQQPISIIQEYGTTLNFPNTVDSTSATGKIAILLSLIRTIQTTLLTGETRTIRDVYYSNVELYGNQKKVDYWLLSITRNLHLETRDHLHILPAQKGLCYSPFDIEVETNGKRTLIAAHSSSMIPYLTSTSIVHIRRPSKQDCKLKVIVLEKEAVYNTIIKASPPPEAIIITGKGYPDFLSRIFLHLLQQNDCIEDWRLYTDADPHGIDIASKYMQNENSEQYMCRSLIYKGVAITDLLKRRDVQFLQLHQRDISLAIGMMKRLSKTSSPLHRSLGTQLQRQMFFMKKAEMNLMPKEEYFL